MNVRISRWNDAVLALRSARPRPPRCRLALGRSTRRSCYSRGHSSTRCRRFLRKGRPGLGKGGSRALPRGTLTATSIERSQRMRPGRVRRFWIGLLLALLMVPELTAAQEAPFAIERIAAGDAGRWRYSLVTPLAAGEEAPLAVAGIAVTDAGRWPYSLAAPLAGAEEAPFAVVERRTRAGRTPRRRLRSLRKRRRFPSKVPRPPSRRPGRTPCHSWRTRSSSKVTHCPCPAAFPLSTPMCSGTSRSAL